MKANQVLKLYQNGIRNFRGESLQNQSFNGHDLSGSDFSEANIQGTNFEGAKLQGVIFNKAKAGLEIRWMSVLMIASFLLSALSGLCLALGSYLVSLMSVTNSLESVVVSRAVLLILIAFLLSTMLQGIEKGLVFLSVASVFAIAGALTLVVTGAFSVAETVAGAIAGTLAGAFAGAIAVAIAGTLAGAFAGAIAVAIAGTLAVTFAGIMAETLIPDLTRAGTIAITIPVIIIIFSAYISWRALAGDNKYALLRKIAIAIVATGGTNFRGADLTDANFTEASLKNTDFRNANLARTCFKKTKKLDHIRPGLTYLQQAELIKVLTKGQGKDKNFDRQDLRGVNFQGAYLVDASFIGADLSEANLQDADLSRAILKQTQLDATDFTGTTLTGAIIEDWGITNETKFRGVRCEYVYMRLPTKEKPDPWRKPDNNSKTFADGEFGDFIKPIVDTLDLYHNQGVDPRAIAISFKQLAEKNSDAQLRIVGMEVKGEDKFLLRAKTTKDADKSKLSAEYFEIYNHAKTLVEQEVKGLLVEKDNQIRRLEIMVMTALERPSFYSNTQIEEVGNMTNNPGGFSVGGSVSGDIKNLQGDNNRAVQGDNNQVIQGDGNQVGVDTEAPLSKDNIVKLLEELEALVLKAELPEETKETAIEDISAAKKATQKEEPKKNVALANLESVTQTLEKTSKTVDAGQKLWSKAKPIITKIAGWLGAAAGSYLLKL